MAHIRFAMPVLALVLLSTWATPASAGQGLTCGQVVTKSVGLDRDLGPCAGDGLVAGADNITIDLGGHRVFGSAAIGNESAGIRIPGKSGVQVRDGAVSAFDAGVAILAGARNNSLSGLLISDNIGSPDGNLGDGVFIAHSRDNAVTNSTIRHNGPFEGVGVFGNDVPGAGNSATGNRIQANTLEDNNVPNTNLEDIFPVPYSDTHGVNLGDGLAGSSTTTISRNTIRNSGFDGILACSEKGHPCVSTDNVITDNQVLSNGFNAGREYALGNGEGIRIAAIGDNGTPSYPGDDVFDVPTRNVVQGNTVKDSAQEGIFVGSVQNRIINNVATGNSVEGATYGGDVWDLNGFCSNVWAGNVYGFAVPCATRGGRQVSSSTGPGNSGEKSRAPWATQGERPTPPVHRRQVPSK